MVSTYAVNVGAKHIIEAGHMTQIPVVLIVFNRPIYTKLVFNKIREQRPKKLYIIGDGPRLGSQTDQERCAAVREILDGVDWPCEIHRNYADTNMGLKQRVSSGLKWVFEQVESAIILEDDCLPHNDFFSFCEVLLDRYANDNSVAVITGTNFQGVSKRKGYSYYFSKYNVCWGWATWRRAWQNYNENISFWPEWSTSASWLDSTPDKVERQYWAEIFERVHLGKVDSWAYPWTASVWYHGGLTLTPNVNLVSNIGFGQESTHTSNADSDLANIQTQNIGEITHPPKVVRNILYDRYIFDYSIGGRYLRFPFTLLNFLRRSLAMFYIRLKQVFF